MSSVTTYNVEYVRRLAEDRRNLMVTIVEIEHWIRSQGLEPPDPSERLLAARETLPDPYNPNYRPKE